MNAFPPASQPARVAVFPLRLQSASFISLSFLPRLATAKVAAAAAARLGSLSLGMLIRKLLKIIKNFRGLSDETPPF